MRQTRQLAAIAAMAAAWITGCASPPPEAQPEPPAGQIDQLRRQLDLRDEQIHLLETTITEKEATIGDLRIRANVLTNRILRLQEDVDQLKEQLRVVGDAPRQRDQYKALYEQSQAEIRRLQAELEAMKGAQRPTATAPTGSEP